MRKGGNLERLTKILEHGFRYSIEIVNGISVISFGDDLDDECGEKAERGIGRKMVFDTHEFGQTCKS